MGESPGHNGREGKPAVDRVDLEFSQLFFHSSPLSAVI